MEEEDCTLFFDDLKSDDNNIKINSLSKLRNISKLIGPQKTKLLLIPTIIDIIEDNDNDEEFLAKLAI